MSQRNIIVTPVSNSTSKENLEKTILFGDHSSWAWKSNGKSNKLHKMHNSICKGDILLFPIKKKCSFIGVVMNTTRSKKIAGQIGWEQGNDIYDLVVNFKIIKCTIDNILNYINWSGVPTGASKVKADATKFWDAYSDTILESGIVNKPVPQNMSYQGKYVYILIKEGDNSMVKIGNSINPKHRVRSFNKVPGQPIILLYKIFKAHNELGEVLEKRVHKLLIEYNIKIKGCTSTEWFSITAEEATEIIIAENEKMKLLWN